MARAVPGQFGLRDGAVLEGAPGPLNALLALRFGFRYQAPSVVPQVSCVPVLLKLELGVRDFRGPYQSQLNRQFSLLKIHRRGAYW